MNTILENNTINEIPTFDGVEKRVYTVEEIQDILGISQSSAYVLVKQNLFKCVNVGRHIRISKKSFDEWLECAY